MGVLICYAVILALVCQSRSLAVRNPLYRIKRYQENERASVNDCPRTWQPVIQPNAYNYSMDIRMPGVIPAVSEAYLCVAVQVPRERESYIVDFVPHASMDITHHMLLYGCSTPSSTDSYWDCGTELGPCVQDSKIIYAWARNAPPTRLPKDVGFKVGGDTTITHFVLQMHYGDVSAFRDGHRDCSGVTLKMTSKPQPFIAGVYLMMSTNTKIPPGKKVTNADIACPYRSYPMYPFAFRTHTHRLGKVVSGYRVRDGKWTLIGRQSPQLPQAFYPAANAVEVLYGDTLAARCVFTGEGKTTVTTIGGTSEDEMCNFYIMYYMDSKHAVPYMNCIDDEENDLFRNIPKEANIPVPVSPEMMMAMQAHGHHTDFHDGANLQEREEEAGLDQGDFYSLLSKLLGEREDVVHVHKYYPPEAERAQADLVAEIDSIIQKKDLLGPNPRVDPNERGSTILVRDRIHKFHQLESTLKPPGRKIMPAKTPGSAGERTRKQGYHLEEMVDWPEVQLQLGQVSGLAVDSSDNLVIFHRGDHRWGVNSFDNQRIYQQRSLGPIQQSTILVVDPVKGKVLKASGRNMFYLPHGITTDKNDNYWVTDVALHQVFKLGPDGRDKPLVVLGQAFEPGDDKNHFCQPTDVAVDPLTGNVYVSDGYCNSRILHFSAEGNYLRQWGAESSDKRKRIPFKIPHSLAFLPDKRELCVADRENGRIQCFLAESGQFVKEIKKNEFGGEVFAISYSPVHGGLIYAVNGESTYGQSAPPQGFVISYSTKEILDYFSPDTQEFKMPHDIVVTKDGSVFVGDVATDTVIKFISAEKAEHRSVKKGGIEVQEIEETETFVQTHLKPLLELPAQPPEAAPQETPEPPRKLEEKQKMESKAKQSAQGVSVAIITTLLLIPLVLVIAIGVFLRWRKTRMYRDDSEVKLEPSSSGGLLEKIRGKAGGGLNLGNFFASHRGYSRKGFDRLSTEGSDQEKDDEDATDSENEEYSAPPPAASAS
ncbi:peptidyl-glycine alpha-amidating monooxygenase B isoform X1 [Brienomyrus brachyistius]|uniref:peptidyl-glycine alpha-amidating monooxygenase B isoform X1 n=1 Tax=Brienomyrus brachyistius TaxID=42636 RepID=UPI0020B29A31|nr:peptidyl-glycine alpha-amidating monooxygenase B isoform X1 [Brienomyrus brachyistius]XP_048875329.1 peptidyl-glycine alpha-amidating monooxygenase B isoform X1 [Brienomyrus brachyistius]XP_048875330.1 peptidyl-glycine alpha-amidating monooxygenase B isoform X1 [Brienomyrus brachyistius]